MSRGAVGALIEKTGNLNLDLSLLEETLTSRYNINKNFKYFPFDLELLKVLNLSQLTSTLFAGNIPSELQTFLESYFSSINNGESFCVTEQDITESTYSFALKCYLRCLDKLFSDYCMLKGLSFKDYSIEHSFFVESNNTYFSYNYNESMYNYYIYMLFNPEETFTDVAFDPFNPQCKRPLGNGVPVIVPNHSDFFLSWSQPTTAVIIKIKGT